MRVKKGVRGPRWLPRASWPVIDQYGAFQGEKSTVFSELTGRTILFLYVFRQVLFHNLVSCSIKTEKAIPECIALTFGKNLIWSQEMLILTILYLIMKNIEKNEL